MHGDVPATRPLTRAGAWPRRRREAAWRSDNVCARRSRQVRDVCIAIHAIHALLCVTVALLPGLLCNGMRCWRDPRQRPSRNGRRGHSDRSSARAREHAHLTRSTASVRRPNIDSPVS